MPLLLAGLSNSVLTAEAQHGRTSHQVCSCCISISLHIGSKHLGQPTWPWRWLLPAGLDATDSRFAKRVH